MPKAKIKNLKIFEKVLKKLLTSALKYANIYSQDKTRAGTLKTKSERGKIYNGEQRIENQRKGCEYVYCKMARLLWKRTHEALQNGKRRNQKMF